MTSNENGVPSGADRLAHVTVLLQRYPDLPGEELDTLKLWFDKEATALDMGTLASDPNIASGYTRFRKEHVDRFGGKDIVLICAVLAVVAIAIALIVY